MLTGNPISGAILHSPDYFWDKAIIFNAVCISALLVCVRMAHVLQLGKVLVIVSSVCMAISRGILVKMKGTQWV